jgi:phospholipid-binding lipoprotein MlaA
MPRTLSRQLQFLVVACLALSGCAAGPNPRDPYEGFNRGVYAFNDGLDKAVLKPVAKGYEAIFPQFLRTGVTNFFDNMGVVVTGVNELAQLKFRPALEDVGRFALNLTLGIGGLFDVATPLKFERHNEDFGQTLGYWGVGSGPYLVLPFFGPSDLRDGLALPVDIYSSPIIYYIDEPAVTNTLLGVYVVNTRANLIPAEKMLEQAAIDKYAFMRDAYLQRREYLIRDGKEVPAASGGRQKTLKELEEEDLGDEPPPVAPPGEKTQ